MIEASPPDSSSILVWRIDPGTVLARRYRVEEKLGEGATACVYLCFDLQLGRRVALKVLDPLRGADPVGRSRFDREFELLTELSHRGIARSLDRARHGDLELIALEHLEGETLRSRLDRGRLEVSSAIEIARQLAEALSVCHRRGILHRDLKPENVMLHPERGAVILDFGVAWFSAAATLTRTGAVIGSPQYLAPEVLRSSVADQRADVYALGVILFEMLAGQPPYPAESIDVLSLGRPTGEVPSVFALRPEVGPALSACVARAMATRAEDRFATVEELRRALDQPGAWAGRTLEVRLPCPSCKGGRIIDLPFCPGCGEAVVWALRTGPYAVQIESVDNASGVAAWLLRRHSQLLRTRSGKLLERRFHYLPAPLAVGVCRLSAEQLAAEAARVGASATVIRTRRLGGPSLRASEASTLETLGALAAHLVLTCLLGLALGAAGVGWPATVGLPGVVGIAGVFAVWLYTRRSLLRVRVDERDRPQFTARVLRLAERLKRLEHERSRRLAAQAFARAAPVVLGDLEGLGPGIGAAVIELLEDAIDQVAQVDVHTAGMEARSRAELAHRMDAAQLRLERGDEQARQDLGVLQIERDELVEVALAHDVCVRRALELSAEIAALVSVRTTGRDVERELAS